MDYNTSTTMINEPQAHEVIPSAARLVKTLRDVGYEFRSAVADLIDNSIAAKATRVDITPRFNDGDPWIRITDNGKGMSPSGLNEALRYGSHRERYEDDEMGKFGLGLKTATHSQCRSLTVATKQSQHAPVEARQHDLDHFEQTDKWEILSIPPHKQPLLLTQPLASYESGTVVVWQRLDRVLDYRNPKGSWAKTGFYRRIQELEAYLAMVFHRFLAGEVPGRSALEIILNKSRIEPWDPFCRQEDYTEQLPSTTFDVPVGKRVGNVYLQPFVLPNRHQFSSPENHIRAGRGRWTDYQGLWIYRANRLIQTGGWSNLRTKDEHTKYARAAVDFFPDMDDAFKINIAKMRVVLPDTLRESIDGPLTTLLRRANELYRAGARDLPPSNQRQRTRSRTRKRHKLSVDESVQQVSQLIKQIGDSLVTAASNVGEQEAFDRIRHELTKIDEQGADALGW